MKVLRLLDKLLFCAVVTGLVVNCGKEEDEDKKSDLNVSVQSTGALALPFELLGSRGREQGALLTAQLLASSDLDLDSFKIPIGRINLTYGDTGSGYTGTSPAFYSCPSDSADECLVDLLKTDVNDLIGDDGDAGSVVFNEPQTYTGIAVEFCPDNASGESKNFNAYVKGTAVLGDKTYYTNAENGLSEAGPAEEVAIQLECQGMSTDLLEEITINPEDRVNVSLWVEPTAAVFVTTDGNLANSNCTSDSGAAMCVSYPAIFGTVDDGKQKVERHLADVQTVDENGNAYADFIITTVYNSDNQPFGAAVQLLYTNKSVAKSLHSHQLIFSGILLTDGSLTFQYQKEGSTKKLAWLENMPRGEAATGLKVSEFAEEELTINTSVID